MGVSSEVGDSICIFLQAFDIRIGLVCCAFISRLFLGGVHASRQRLYAELQSTGKMSKVSSTNTNTPNTIASKCLSLVTNSKIENF